jgi:Ser/Thr protein kinase RdoA (MazF antagonist)
VAELDALALAMARLHSLPTAGLWLAHGSEIDANARVLWFRKLLAGYVAWAEVNFPPGLACVARCEALIKEAGGALQSLERTMPKLVFCRSDPRFANVITRADGRLGFVDWEDAGLRDPALEVADMLLHPEQEDLLTQPLADAFLASYCGYTGVSEADFAARVAEYCRVLPIFWLLITLRYGVRMAEKGRLINWHSNEMPGHQRLLRYLARANAGTLWDFGACADAEVRFFPTE